MTMKAIRERVNGILFDSRLEAEGYRILTSIYGIDRILVQYPVTLNYDDTDNKICAISHKIDFAVLCPKKQKIIKLVEIKGTLVGQWKGRQEYALLLNLMMAVRPELFSIYQVWVADKELSFFAGKVLPFVRRFPFSDLERAKAYLS